MKVSDWSNYACNLKSNSLAAANTYSCKTPRQFCRCKVANTTANCLLHPPPSPFFPGCESDVFGAKRIFAEAYLCLQPQILICHRNLRIMSATVSDRRQPRDAQWPYCVREVRFTDRRGPLWLWLPIGRYESRVSPHQRPMNCTFSRTWAVSYRYSFLRRLYHLRFPHTLYYY